MIKQTIIAAAAVFFATFGVRADGSSGSISCGNLYPGTTLTFGDGAFGVTGVSVNGCDVEAGEGDGWTFADGVLTLSGAGPYVLSGTNTAGEVRVRQVADATVTLSNLVLTVGVTAPTYEVGAGEKPEGAVTATILLAGDNHLIHLSGSEGPSVKQAAIFVNKCSSVVFDVAAGFADADAKLTVQGGYGGAGIGGCRDHSTGTITIDGGTIHAAGGRYAAGIGGGFYKGTSYETPGSVVINGGRIVAIGYNSSPGIGMGYSYDKGLGYDVRITGGTVSATSNLNFGPGIASMGKDQSGPGVVLSGGSVNATVVSPTNGVATVYCVTVPGDWEDGTPVVIEGIADYGMNDIVSDGGSVYLWLPDGDYEFTVNGVRYVATVDGAATTATRMTIAYLNWDAESKTMTNAVCSVFEFVTADTATLEDGKWYAVTGTVSRGQINVDGSAHLILCDGAKLTAQYSSKPQSGVRVTKGNALSIYGQTEGTGVLEATGYHGAGIGANDGDAAGSGVVTINGGKVTAKCDSVSGAGIGGGNGNSNGEVIINGGTVTATGGYSAAGIGGGNYWGSGGIVTINGGTIVATAGLYAAGIGGGYNASDSENTCNGATVTINGGKVTAIGNDCPAIGAGGGGTSPGTITFGTDSVWLVKAGDDADSASEVAYTAFAADHTQQYVFIESREVAPTQPKIASIKLTTTVGGTPQVEVRFSAEGFGTYALKRTQDLTTPIAEWDEIATVTGCGENLLLADPAPPADKAFYTVVAE